jgi:hypothetical protein
MRILRRTLLQLPAAALVHAAAPRHNNVFNVKGRFGGWPANHGMWAWGDELLAGFEAGYFRFNEERGREHAIDYSKPAEHLLARSLDGGETWKIEKPAGLKPPPGVKVAGVPVESDGRPETDSPGNFNFKAPGFALTARMTSIHTGPSRFYVTNDKGHNWQGPFKLPDFGTPGIAARTDHRRQSEQARRPRAVRAHHRWRENLEDAELGLPRTGGRRLRDHAVQCAVECEVDSHNDPPPQVHRGVAQRRQRRVVEHGGQAGRRHRRRQSADDPAIAGRKNRDDLWLPQRAVQHSRARIER